MVFWVGVPASEGAPERRKRRCCGRKAAEFHYFRIIMRIVIQRVSQASVTVNGTVVGAISAGMVVLLGVAQDDECEDADYLVRKITELRIFEDEAGKMNRCAREVNGAFLVVSQFTLLGDCQKGRRPSFDKAAEPQQAEALYEYFIKKLREENATVACGTFAAMMDVALVNDGPVTFVLDSR